RKFRVGGTRSTVGGDIQIRGARLALSRRRRPRPPRPRQTAARNQANGGRAPSGRDSFSRRPSPGRQPPPFGIVGPGQGRIAHVAYQHLGSAVVAWAIGRARNADLGRRASGRLAAMVGVLVDRSTVMPMAIPLATYRLQLTSNFTFDDAAAVASYLQALG